MDFFFWSRSHYPYRLAHVLLLFSSCLSFSLSVAQFPTKHLTNTSTNKGTASCLLVFGDSTVDSGNNNYIPTLFKSNFPPYGRDFKDHIPTGRFTNGRLTTDFIASYAGLKEDVPAYLDPSLSIEDLMTGVSFASAGTGFDPLTATISDVIDMPTQLKFMKEYKSKIESAIGKERMEDHINEAVFVISAGTNDFVNTYFGTPIRRKTFTVSAYQQFVLSKVKELIQNLWEEGARKMVVTGLPPIGCGPAVITLYSKDPIRRRDCIERFSSIARDYNSILQKELNSIRANQGLSVYYTDIYTPLHDIIQGNGRSEFEYVDKGCCGTGFLEGSVTCNPNTYVCPDASKYVFFDAIHPTEKVYYKLFQTFQPVMDLVIRAS